MVSRALGDAADLRQLLISWALFSLCSLVTQKSRVPEAVPRPL